MNLVLQEITRGLQDPLHPTLCTACLCAFTFDYIDPDEADADKARIRELRRNYHELCDSALKFITAACMIDDFKLLGGQLVRAMQACRHASATHSYYVRAAAPHKSEFVPLKVVSTLLYAIRLCLQDSPILSERFSRRGLWPTRPSDLLLGSTDTFHALQLWMPRLLDRYVVDMLKYVFVLCKDEGLAYLLDPEQRDALFERICDCLKAATTTGLPYRGPLEGLTPHAQMYALSDLLWTIFSAVTQTPGHSRCFDGHERMLIDAIHPALDVMPHGPEREHLAIIAGHILRPIDRILLKAELHPYVLEQLEKSSRALPEAFQSLYQLLRSLSQRCICALPGCGRREHDLGRALQLCGACRVLKYCSSQCQKQHWKAQPHPHNEICSRLCGVGASFATKLGEDEFVRRCQTADVALDDILQLFGAVTSHVSARNSLEYAEEVSRKLRFQDTNARNADAEITCLISGVPQPMRLSEMLPFTPRFFAGYDL